MEHKLRPGLKKMRGQKKRTIFQKNARAPTTWDLLEQCSWKCCTRLKPLWLRLDLKLKKPCDIRFRTEILEAIDYSSRTTNTTSAVKGFRQLAHLRQRIIQNSGVSYLFFRLFCIACRQTNKRLYNNYYKKMILDSPLNRL